MGCQTFLLRRNLILTVMLICLIAFPLPFINTNRCACGLLQSEIILYPVCQSINFIFFFAFLTIVTQSYNLDK